MHQQTQLSSHTEKRMKFINLSFDINLIPQKSPFHFICISFTFKMHQIFEFNSSLDFWVVNPSINCNIITSLFSTTHSHSNTNKMPIFVYFLLFLCYVLTFFSSFFVPLFFFAFCCCCCCYWSEKYKDFFLVNWVLFLRFKFLVFFFFFYFLFVLFFFFLDLKMTLFQFFFFVVFNLNLNWFRIFLFLSLPSTITQ